MHQPESMTFDALEAAAPRSRSRTSLSPRKSPKKSAFQAVKGSVSFTPQKTKQPRAWERKPATPFVPRDDKQKIWKRVPLGELGIDSNRNDPAIRREDAGRKDYQKIVKKQKTAHEETDDEDKENVFLNIGESSEKLGGVACKSTSFVSTKLETEEITGSPKKKIRSSQSESSVEVRDELLSDGENVPAEESDNAHDLIVEEEELEVTDEQEFSNSNEFQKGLPAQPLAHLVEAARANHREEPISTSDHERSSSPPTILAENVVIDELHERQLDDEEKENAISCADETAEQSKANDQAQKATSEDDADYLRDFMSRSKASRAAREQASSIPAADESHAIEPTTTSSQDSQPGHQAQSDQAETAEDPNMELTIRSPLRRSKRSAVTTVPQAQSIPNAIQLKRANGNEFIFSANKSTSSANVALTTRCNTKKNKGTAQDVKTRLDELAAEGIVELLDLNAGKKRNKLEKRKPAKKVLKWNDENLVSYQEPDNREWDDVGPGNEADTESASDQERHVRLIVRPPRMVSNEEVVAKKSVRSARRGVIGTVNGTPAPKKRSQRLQEQDEQDEAAEAQTITVGGVVIVADGGLHIVNDGTKIVVSPKRVRVSGPTTLQKPKTAIPRAIPVKKTSSDSQSGRGVVAKGRNLRTRQ